MEEHMGQNDTVYQRFGGSGFPGFPAFISGSGGGGHQIVLLILVLIVLFAVFRGNLFGGDHGNGNGHGLGLHTLLGGALVTNNASEKVIAKVECVQDSLENRFGIVNEKINKLQCENRAELAEIRCLAEKEKLQEKIDRLQEDIRDMKSADQEKFNSVLVKKLNAIECNLGINDNCCPVAPAPAPAVAMASINEAMQSMQAQILSLATKVASNTK